jgi:hypothetical protein
VHLCLFSFNPLHKTKYASTKMTVLQAIPASSLCVQGGGGGGGGGCMEVRYHITDYAEKIKMVAV